MIKIVNTFHISVILVKQFDEKSLNNIFCRMNIQTLIALSRENSTFVTRKSVFSLRQQTTTFLFQLRHLLFTARIKQDIVGDLLRPFGLYFEQLNALPIVDALHTIHSTQGNEVSFH